MGIAVKAATDAGEAVELAAELAPPHVVGAMLATNFWATWAAVPIYYALLGVPMPPSMVDAAFDPILPAGGSPLRTEAEGAEAGALGACDRMLASSMCAGCGATAGATVVFCQDTSDIMEDDEDSEASMSDDSGDITSGDSSDTDYSGCEDCCCDCSGSEAGDSDVEA